MTPLPRHLLSITALTGLLVVGLQGVAMVQQATSEERSLRFTPYSAPTVYRLNAAVGGQPLTDTQVRERYGLPFRGKIGLTPEALHAIVIRRESVVAPRTHDVYVRMHVSRQGGPEEIWLWPQQ